ncbi:MAG: hypothetical protein OHK0039_31160 [Bacteroidia bacterium]
MPDQAAGIGLAERQIGPGSTDIDSLHGIDQRPATEGTLAGVVCHEVVRSHLPHSHRQVQHDLVLALPVGIETQVALPEMERWLQYTLPMAAQVSA